MKKQTNNNKKAWLSSGVSCWFVEWIMAMELMVKQNKQRDLSIQQ